MCYRFLRMRMFIIIKELLPRVKHILIFYLSFRKKSLLVLFYISLLFLENGPNFYKQSPTWHPIVVRPVDPVGHCLVAGELPAPGCGRVIAGVGGSEYLTVCVVRTATTV